MEQRERPVPNETWEWVRDQNIWRYRSKLKSPIGDEESMLVRQLLAEELDKAKAADEALHRTRARGGAGGARSAFAQTARDVEKPSKIAQRTPLAARIKALCETTARHFWRSAKVQ